MKIEKSVKNRAKQAKVGDSKITYLAFEKSNMAPIPSKTPKFSKKCLNLKSRIFAIYACGHTVQYMVTVSTGTTGA